MCSVRSFSTCVQCISTVYSFVVESPLVKRIDGIGTSREWKLVAVSIETIDDLANATIETISAAAGVSEATAPDWINTADLYRQSYDLT